MLIRKRLNTDIPQVIAMLETAALPPEGLQLTDGWVCEDEGRILGHVAAEMTAEAAVLRSLVVDPSAQGQGLGLKLMLEAERAMGHRVLVLRTDTVGPWMQRHGYVRVSLDQVPASVRATTQFEGTLCSQCPIYMKKPDNAILSPESIKSEVRARYGAIAATSGSCCGPNSGCGCGDSSLNIGYAVQDLTAVPDGANLGLGCGNPVALASLRSGEVVLDLGSGAGFDAFLAAQRVGPTGRVIGVDMTPEMLAKARNLAVRHGYLNVEFRQGDIEALPVEDNSVDAIISNCVINLTTDKARTFREAHRVLKPGGRVMVSDLVLLKPLPPAIQRDMDAYAACLSGALLKEDYLAAIEAAGFEQIAVVGESSFDFGDPSTAQLEAARHLAPELTMEDLRSAAASVASIKISAFKAPAPVSIRPAFSSQ